MYEVTRPVARTLPQARNGGDVRAHRAAVDSSRPLLSRVGSFARDRRRWSTRRRSRRPG